MKGTLFSADFVKDSSGTLRMLEINTETTILAQEFDNCNFNNLFDVLQSNNITELHLIYKPYVHQDLVEYLKAKVEAELSYITDVVLHPQDLNTIYPSTPDDQADRFILRLTYDESALLDSTYAKGRLNTYNLFTDAGITDYTVAHYYEGNGKLVDTLVKEFNTGTVPDAAIKDVDETFNPIDFHKIGRDGETATERWDAFVAENKAPDKLIEQYHHDPASKDGNKITSVRYFGIVYGPSITVLDIHTYNVSSIFELPTDVSSEVDNNSYSNKLEDYHTYEYRTNYIKGDSAGILSTHKILKIDDTWEEIDNIEVGNEIKSYYISGSPMVESNSEIAEWSFEGSEFPLGSELTSSAVVFKDARDLKYHGIIELVVDGDSLFSGINKQYLIYDTSSNLTSFKQSTFIDPDTDFFYDIDSNLIDIDEANFYITKDKGLKFIELDVEDTDTYIISGSTAFHSVVSHNAPCFVGGTEITLANGDIKNIEDVVVGDQVLTFNHTTDKLEGKEVLNVIAKKVNNTVKYTFANGKTLEATVDHPIYAGNGEYVSFLPELTKKLYGFQAGQAEVGTTIFTENKTSVEIAAIEQLFDTKTVYNLHNVTDNHNYFANMFLVHNRCFVAGTKITLPNGTAKNIEDIASGDEVLSYNTTNGENEVGVVTTVKKHRVETVTEITFEDDTVTVTTPEHPFYVKGYGWTKAEDLKYAYVCQQADFEGKVIARVETLQRSVEVYNLLDVTENHNFYANDLLVHNK